jgi:uncharacterized protein (TIGR02266 family)
MNMENRSAPRLSARLRVHYGLDDQILLQNYTVNLSTGGMFLETEVILPVDTPCTLEFFLGDDDKCITCQARVAWINSPDNIKKEDFPFGMGLQFQEITLEQLHIIREFIAQKGVTATW